jgi:structure-specific endonuclease subunit SLX1
MSKEEKYWCYIIQNTDEKYKNHTYVGYTVDPAHRLRQHNREIKGGAKATNKGLWKFMALITGFKTSQNALSCEWKLKHPDGKRRKATKYNGIDGRILSLKEVFVIPKNIKIKCFD